MFITIGNVPSQTERNKKGKSLIDFPTSYTVIDLETTGLSPVWNSIIEVSAIKVDNSEIIDTFSSLTNSDYGVFIDDYIAELTGITQEMIDNAPTINTILPQYLDFIGEDIVVGHNVNFDVNFLYDNSMNLLGEPFSNNFIDTMRISRRLHPEFSHHRLHDLASRYNIDLSSSHRALNDCHITFNCFLNLQAEIKSNYASLSDFVSICNTGVRASNIHSSKLEFDHSHPLYNKVCVFTGTLEKLKRKDAMQLVADLGGINKDNVTTETNFLILGNNDYCSLIKDGKSNKQKKAEKYKLQGYDIEIISENVFYDMIFDD